MFKRLDCTHCLNYKIVRSFEYIETCSHEHIETCSCNEYASWYPSQFKPSSNPSLLYLDCIDSIEAALRKDSEPNVDDVTCIEMLNNLKETRCLLDTDAIVNELHNKVSFGYYSDYMKHFVSELRRNA